MSRDEVVRIACRAVSIVQIVTAVLEISYLPQWSVSLARDVKRANDFVVYDRIGLAFLFFRIAFLLVAAAVLWNCGPWIQRLMGTLQRPGVQEEQS